jgi:hypothetical protein
MNHYLAMACGLTIFSMLIAPSASADTADCEAITAATVSELKAGAADWWTEDTARMAGMAAASACFKTLSAVAESSIESKETRQASDDDAGAAEETTEFMGLEVRPLSGPPSRKPYERTRD